jgi:hypothetical protein
MKSEKIYNMVTRDYESVDMNIGKALASNEEYIKSSKNFDTLLDTLDIKMRIKLSDEAVNMGRITQDEAFSEGFAHAVKIMSACFSKPSVEDA